VRRVPSSRRLLSVLNCFGPFGGTNFFLSRESAYSLASPSSAILLRRVAFSRSQGGPSSARMPQDCRFDARLFSSEVPKANMLFPTVRSYFPAVPKRRAASLRQRRVASKAGRTKRSLLFVIFIHVVKYFDWRRAEANQPSCPGSGAAVPSDTIHTQQIVSSFFLRVSLASTLKNLVWGYPQQRSRVSSS